MIRGIILLILAVLVITFLRAVIGLVTRAMSDAISPSKPDVRATPTPGGELKRDPVCGTYVAAATSVKKTVGAKVVHFCSTECRDRYHA
jgi:YHS domain-containing protein